MWGWLIPLILIVLGIFSLCNSTPTTTIIGYDDGARDIKYDDDTAGGGIMILIGVIWLVVKIIRLF